MVCICMENSILIPLGVDGSSGMSATIDESDLSVIAGYTWSYNRANGYAVYTNRKNPLRMHRLIVNAPQGMEVDHINGDRLDNRRCNLRLATKAENVRNQKLHKNNTTGFKGVCWDKRGKTFNAKIMLNRKTINIGRYETAEEAYAAYCKSAAELFGEFANNG